ncbi:MAG TPA: hypothetical protein VHA11_03575 [Bryobacteraceae bacterium]|nr:hypothetical protein [Bryobacteraceae bacterium]
MKTPLSLLLTCALLFPQLGCKSNTTDRLVVSLGAVSAASAVAIAVAMSLEADEAIDSVTATRIVTYSQAVSLATSKAISELGADETDRMKILKITAIFAAVPPVVIGDEDPKAAAVIQAIQVAVETLLAQLTAASKAVPAAATPAQAALTKEHLAELAKIDAQARRAVTVASRWSPAHPLLAAGYMK